MGLSILYFLLAFLTAIIAVTATVSVARPVKPRLRGLSILGIVLLYAVVSLLLADLWGDLMNKWYGQWPAFTFGIVFGIPVLVVTAGTAIGILIVALNAMVRGLIPAWMERARSGAIRKRLVMAMAIVALLVVVGGIVLAMVLRTP